MVFFFKNKSFFSFGKITREKDLQTESQGSKGLKVGHSTSQESQDLSMGASVVTSHASGVATTTIARGDWANLSPDLLRLVFKWIKPGEDFPWIRREIISSQAVCKAWSSVNFVEKSILMFLPFAGTEHRELYSFTDGTVHEAIFDGVGDKLILCSAEGWLLLLDMENGELSLKNPWTGQEMDLLKPQIDPKQFRNARGLLSCPYESDAKVALIFPSMDNTIVIWFFEVGTSQWFTIDANQELVKECTFALLGITLFFCNSKEIRAYNPFTGSGKWNSVELPDPERPKLVFHQDNEAYVLTHRTMKLLKVEEEDDMAWKLKEIDNVTALFTENYNVLLTDLDVFCDSETYFPGHQIFHATDFYCWPYIYLYNFRSKAPMRIQCPYFHGVLFCPSFRWRKVQVDFDSVRKYQATEGVSSSSISEDTLQSDEQESSDKNKAETEEKASEVTEGDLSSKLSRNEFDTEEKTTEVIE